MYHHQHYISFRGIDQLIIWINCLSGEYDEIGQGSWLQRSQMFLPAQYLCRIEVTALTRSWLE